LDDLIPDPWPQGIVAALDQWRQGHLFKGDTGVWLSNGGGVDAVTGDDLTIKPPGLVPRAAQVGDTGYLAVVSQTCDIVATGPGVRHPFVQACPVRDVSGVGVDKVQAIRDGTSVEYVYLTQPPVPGTDWAIDLRISVPISKAVLAAATPITGFSTAAEHLVLGARLAAKIERPALHDYLSKELVDSLDRLLSKAKKSEQWCDDVEQIRLQVEGDALHPTRVRLFVITDVNFNWTPAAKPIRDLWKSHKRALAKHNIKTAPVAFRTHKTISIADYRESIPINLPTLGRGRFS
jgi:hypothetical protein